MNQNELLLSIFNNEDNCMKFIENMKHLCDLTSKAWLLCSSIITDHSYDSDDEYENDYNSNLTSCMHAITCMKEGIKHTFKSHNKNNESHQLSEIENRYKNIVSLFYKMIRDFDSNHKRMLSSEQLDEIDRVITELSVNVETHKS